MIKRYGLFGSYRLFKSLVFTRIFYPRARLIRLPFDIRNKRYIAIGDGFTCGFGCRLEAFPTDINNNLCIRIGRNVQLNDYVHIGAVGSITIGDDVLMASKIYISDHNHGNYDKQFSDSPFSNPIDRKPIVKPVIIGDRVWIGESCCILPGVTIGEGSIIGALSVVTKDIPPFSVAVGSPAKVVKKYNFELNYWETITKNYEVK